MFEKLCWIGHVRVPQHILVGFWLILFCCMFHLLYRKRQSVSWNWRNWMGYFTRYTDECKVWLNMLPQNTTSVLQPLLPIVTFDMCWHSIKCIKFRRRNTATKAQRTIRLIDQSGRSPEVVALFSATKQFSSNIIELLQLHDTIQIQWNYAWIHYNITKRSHLII